MFCESLRTTEVAANVSYLLLPVLNSFTDLTLIGSGCSPCSSMGPEANIVVDAAVSPKFCKAGSIPYSWQEWVKNQRKR